MADACDSACDGRKAGGSREVGDSGADERERGEKDTTCTLPTFLEVNARLKEKTKKKKGKHEMRVKLHKSRVDQERQHG